MSSYTPVSIDRRTKKKAILLVHGIGNSKAGEDPAILNLLDQFLGDQAAGYAIYQMHYDGINDWFKEKTDFASQLDSAMGFFKTQIDDPALGDTIADYVGDVIWPVMSQSARSALRLAYIAQLQQMVIDGSKAGIPNFLQENSIICHSLGCFHTYEALHTIAKFKEHKLQPESDGVRFKNVIYMASPVQLIRTVAEKLGPTINKRWLSLLDPNGLSNPSQDVGNGPKASVKKTISITGTLDPVGGFFLNKRAPWAFMDLPGQVTIENKQVLPNENIATLKNALSIVNPDATDAADKRPIFPAENPHDWSAYMENNMAEIQSLFS